MARPKKTPDELRHDQLCMRMTTAERIQVERDASLSGKLRLIDL